MANISDIIEKFILDAMQEGQSLQISRNELANFFSCAPSQINYVLATRFSNERGYDVSSQRGGHILRGITRCCDSAHSFQSQNAG